MNSLVRGLLQGGSCCPRDAFPRASLYLGPGFNFARAIEFTPLLIPWPEELAGATFTVSDPDCRVPLPFPGAPLGEARRDAVLNKMTVVSAALRTRVMVCFSPCDRVLIRPNGKCEHRDTRDAERQFRRQQQARRRRTALEEADALERARAALSILDGTAFRVRQAKHFGDEFEELLPFDFKQSNAFDGIKRSDSSG